MLIGLDVYFFLALVKTRLQVDGIGGQPRSFRGIFLQYKGNVFLAGMCDVFSQTVRHEGFFALYRGLLPNLFKAVSRLNNHSINMFIGSSSSYGVGSVRDV